MTITLKKARLRKDGRLELTGRVMDKISRVGKQICLTATAEMAYGKLVPDPLVCGMVRQRRVAIKLPNRRMIMAKSPDGAQFYTVEKYYSDTLVGGQDYSIESWVVKYFRQD